MSIFVLIGPNGAGKSTFMKTIELMPGWLRTIARFNPLTYEVDGLRGLMLAGHHPNFPLFIDYGVPLVLFILLVAIATRMYPRLSE